MTTTYDTFALVSDFEVRGDQPRAIAELTEGLERGDAHQVLLGVTGSGKTFTMAQVIAAQNRPTLVMVHNKTLAAQLYQEFRRFFPLKRISDYELQVRAVAGPDLQLRKEASAVFGAEQDVESTLDISVVPPSTTTIVIEAQDVQCRTGADVDGPRIVVEGNFVGELKVEGDQDQIVADTNFGIRSEDQPLQQRKGLDMPTEDKLVGVPADANPDADLFLRCTRTSERESKNGEADDRDFDLHARCIGGSIPRR